MCAVSHHIPATLHLMATPMTPKCRLRLGPVRVGRLALALVLERSRVRRRLRGLDRL
jgi:hypothetical protein